MCTRWAAGDVGAEAGKGKHLVLTELAKCLKHPQEEEKEEEALQVILFYSPQKQGNHNFEKCYTSVQRQYNS